MIQIIFIRIVWLFSSERVYNWLYPFIFHIQYGVDGVTDQVLEDDDSQFDNWISIL